MSKVDDLRQFGWALLIEGMGDCLLAKQTRSTVFFMRVYDGVAESLNFEQALDRYGLALDERVKRFRVGFN